MHRSPTLADDLCAAYARTGWRGFITLRRLLGKDTVRMRTAYGAVFALQPGDYIDSVVLRVFPDFDYKKESKRAVRLIRMRELDKATSPGNVLDSALLTQMLVSHVPDFVAGRIQDFEQGQRLIYRKLNLVPVILAGVFQVLSIGFFALFAGLVADRFGLLARVWKMPGAEPVQRALGFLSPYFVIVLVLALVSAWLVRAMKARSFVKVQREG